MSTDLGPASASLPPGWILARLDELFHFLPTASYGWDDLSDAGPVRYVHYGDLHTRFGHSIDLEHHELPRLRRGIQYSVPHLRDGDLIVADASQNAAGVGRSAEVRGIGTSHAIAGLHTFLLRARDDRSVSGYRGFLLDNAYARTQIQRLTTHVTVFGVSKRAFATVCVPLPPPHEQHMIAEVLADMDEQIRALEALIAKKRAIREAATWRLISGEMRLPGLADAWSVRKLGDIALFRKGYGLSKSSLAVGGQRACVHYGELITHYSERIDVVIHGTSDPGTFVVAGTGDVLMPTSAETPEGLVTASCLQIDDVVIGGDILVIRPIDGTINGLFLAHLIKNNRDQVMRRVYGTAVSHLRTEDMATFTARVPRLREQAAIVALLSDMDAGIAALERRLDKTRAIGLGMKQQLLTGRLRAVESGRSSDDSAAFESVENDRTRIGDRVSERRNARRSSDPP